MLPENHMKLWENKDPFEGSLKRAGNGHAQRAGQDFNILQQRLRRATLWNSCRSLRSHGCAFLRVGFFRVAENEATWEITKGRLFQVGLKQKGSMKTGWFQVGFKPMVFSWMETIFPFFMDGFHYILLVLTKPRVEVIRLPQGLKVWRPWPREGTGHRQFLLVR